MSALDDRVRLLAELTRLAEGASRLVLEVYATPFLVEEKAPRDLVTLADKRANAFLVEGLARAFPGVPIVAEESPAADFEGFHRAPACFFVDPLDGTSEFVDRNGEFVVMIGLTENGRPTAGVVMAPVTGHVFRGSVPDSVRGRPAIAEMLSNEGGTQPLVPTPRTDLRGARFVASHRRRTPALESFLADVPEGVVQPLGSAGLKAVAVATGRADAFVHLGIAGKLWDACATEALVTAAGAVVTDAFGKPLVYDSPDLVLASGVVMANAALHPAIIARLSDDAVSSA